MPWLLWGLAAWLAAVLQHTVLAAWPGAPDLPLALAAWALAAGEERRWPWRVWLAGALRDGVDPAAQGFHAIAHALLVPLLALARPWLPAPRPLRAACAALLIGAVVLVLDALVGRAGGAGWHVAAALAFTAGLAALAAWLTPGPARTLHLEEDQPSADAAPERSAGSATPH